MAIKYRISESGIQKVVEVVSDGTVIGVKKFSPKEISVSYTGDTVQINDSFTGNTLYEGEYADFVKADGSAFAQNAGDAVLAMTNLASNIPINIAELDGLELVDNQLLPDLSEYAKTADIQSYVDTGIAPIATSLSSVESVITSNISKHIAYTPVFPIWETQIDTIISYPEISATFTVPANGKVQVLIPLRVDLTQAATFYGLINSANPGENGQVFEGDDDAAQFASYLNSIGHPSIGYGSLYNRGVRMIVCRFPIPDASAFPMQTTTLVSEEITGLTPGAEETIYFWITAGAVHFNCQASFTFTDGIKVLEVLD